MDAAKRPKYLPDSIKPRRANELGTAGAGESRHPAAEYLGRAPSPLSKFPEQILGAKRGDARRLEAWVWRSGMPDQYPWLLLLSSLTR